MGARSRKQREIEQRERLILDAARKILLEEGYFALSMDRVAEQVEYSKGTVYGHFASKEDLISALAMETTQCRVELFQRAALFRGRSRERMVAIGVAGRLFLDLYPHHFRTEAVIHLDEIGGRIEPSRSGTVQRCDMACAATVSGVVRDAVAAGDLTLPDDVSPEELTFGLWSIHFGATVLIGSGHALEPLGVRDPHAALWVHMQRLLDGYGWRPLSHEYDYAETIRRVEREVFADEFASLREPATAR